MDDDPLILASAQHHGVPDDDILHAYAFAMAWYVDDSGDRPMVMFIGPARTGMILLEVGACEREDYDAICIVHAMRARPETLRKGGLTR